MEREKAALGLFLTLNPPTREMEREAASAGFYETGGMKFPRLQILTAAEILDNRRLKCRLGLRKDSGKRVAKMRRNNQSCFNCGLLIRAQSTERMAACGPCHIP